VWDDRQLEGDRRVAVASRFEPVEFQEPIPLVGHTERERIASSVGHVHHDSSRLFAG
jgi:hypothetical protein